MRRDILITSCQKILRDLEDSGIPQMIDGIFERARSTKEEKVDTGPSFEVFRRLTVAHSQYDEDDKRIIQILGLDVLSDPDYWQSLSTKPTPRVLLDLRERVNDATRFLPKFLGLIRQEVIEAVKDQSSAVPDFLKGKESIKLVLPELEGEFSTPSRIIYLLQAVVSLYEVLTAIGNTRGDDLVVLACDSGSDKTIDVAGVGKFMEQLRLLVLGIWDRRVFYRHIPASQSLGIISQSLPVFDEISQLRKSGALSAEEAEILKRKAIDGVTKFVESGAITDDMEQNSAFSPRAIMRTETKLLAAPLSSTSSPENSQDEPASESMGFGGLSVEEVALLQKLLAKTGDSTTSPKPKKPRRTRSKSK